MAFPLVLPYQLPELQQLIYVKTNIGGYFFDAIIRSEHTTSLTITEHPVESGSSVSDHSFRNPSVLVMEIGMSDVSKSLVNGQFEGGWSRSVTAYQTLLELQEQRVPLQVLTRLKLYKNMIIETIAAPDDYTTFYGLKATITLRELIVAVVRTVKISQRPQVTDNTNKGEVQLVKPSQSVLKQLFDGK